MDKKIIDNILSLSKKTFDLHNNKESKKELEKYLISLSYDDVIKLITLMYLASDTNEICNPKLDIFCNKKQYQELMDGGVDIDFENNKRYFQSITKKEFFENYRHIKDNFNFDYAVSKLIGNSRLYIHLKNALAMIDFNFYSI